MSTNERNNEAAIWKNEDRQKNTHPHFKGSALIDGVQYWVSAWKRDPDGNPKAPALKLSFQPKDAPKPAPAPAQEQIDDDIPF